MVKERRLFSEYEKLLLIINGVSYAMNEANEDKKKYSLFKQGYTQVFTEEENKNMQVLSILERLGYSLDELGTYLYKDVIVEVYKKIEDVSRSKNIDMYSVLISQLNDAFSNFYHNLARENKDMGVKSFHLYINKAIEKINDDVDKELSKRIYGDNPEELNYGLQAFQIAAYVADKHAYNNALEYKKPLVKKLPNMPDDIELKYSF